MFFLCVFFVFVCFHFSRTSRLGRNKLFQNWSRDGFWSQDIICVFLVFSLSSLGICFPIQSSSGNVCGPVMRILGISRIFCCHIYLGIWIFATLCREYLKETWFREQNMGMLTKSEDKAMSPTSCYCGSPDQTIRH